MFPEPLHRRSLGDRLQSLAAAASLGAAIVAAAPAPAAHASCDVIPGSLRVFRGSTGSLDRPYASPGDRVTIRLSPACDTASAGFAPSPHDNVISVLFQPPGGATGPHLAAIAADCGALLTQEAACEAAGIGSLTCIESNAADGAPAVEVVEVNGERRIRFRFPDTDQLVGAPADGRTLTGPTAIAVTHRNSPLPCSLATQRCGDSSGLIACIDDFFAVDGTCGLAPHAEFAHFTALPPANDYQAMCYDPSPPCTGTAPEVRFTTDRAGNILLPVDWRAVLVGDAVPVARLVRASTSIEAFLGGGVPIRIPGNEYLQSFSPQGGALPPIFDPQTSPWATEETTLFGTADAAATVLRIARRIAPYRQCQGGTADAAPCATAAHCPGGDCVPARCSGGAHPNQPCATDADCPGAECGPSLFEFRDRHFADVGPVVVGRFDGGSCQAGAAAGLACSSPADCGGEACVAYRLVAEDPAPLEGLSQTQEINGFALAEAIVGRDLNGDGDVLDHVVLLADRRTGVIQPIGADGADGRAVARVREAPFSFPALALEGDLLAFLEPEPLQGHADANGNGRISETILRVYSLGPLEHSPTTPLRAIDAAPVIDGRPLAISEGRVFVRTDETALARASIERVSVAADGAEGDGPSQTASLSGDGRWLAFDSYASTLVADDTNFHCGTNGWGAGSLNCPDIFVRDLHDGTLVRLSVDAAGNQANHASFAPSLSHDGRFLVFFSRATNLAPGGIRGVSDVFLRDRDADGNGIFDEVGPGKATVERISVSSDGFDLASSSTIPSAISADGRFVAFASQLFEPGDTQRRNQLFVRDRLTQTTERVSLDEQGNPLLVDATRFLEGPRLSADGRFVAFRYAGESAVSGDTNGHPDIFVRDRLLGTTERVSLANDGSESDGSNYHFAISGDGRFVAFSTWSSNLVAGVTNNARDVYVRDRHLGTTERVSVGSAGEQASNDSEKPAISADGRFVAFRSDGRNLVPGTSHQQSQIYLHDRLTGLTTRVTQRPDGSESMGGGYYVVGTPSLAADGRMVAFSTSAADLVDGDSNTFCDNNPTDGIVRTDENCADVFIHRAAPEDPLGADRTGDGRLEATVLEVADAASDTVTTLCPAAAVSVATGRAAFLRPESAGVTPALSHCPGGPLVDGNPDLNGDGDADDSVVHFWPGSGSVENLRCAATAVWLSETHIAALVSEASQGDGSLNGDADSDDSVAVVRALSDPVPTHCSDWTRVGPSTHQASSARTADLSGATVAILTAEADEGVDLNGDGDLDDLVLQVFDAATSKFTNTGQAAEDFVLGESLLAFRTREARQGGQDLNGDGDTDDDVLQVLDLLSGEVYSTGQAVTPCRLEACDPRLPYRVLNDTVKFLTFEADQGEDLNGNGSMHDLILQVFNVRLAAHNGSGTPNLLSRSLAKRNILAPQAVIAIGAVNSGICTTSAEPCNTDGECGGGVCFVPPGGCLRNLGNPCNPAIPGECGIDRFCSPSTSTCIQIGVPCRSEADCAMSEVCSPEPTRYRILAPFGSSLHGGEVFIGAGACVEPRETPCSKDAECAGGEVCSAGVCGHRHGPCATDEDCHEGAFCDRRLMVATARDSDNDEIADPFDNCPQVPNILQEDRNGDGIGDACQCDGLLATRHLKRLRHSERPAKSQLHVQSRDFAIVAPPPGSEHDPRSAGGRIELTSPATGRQITWDLPASGWTTLGSTNTPRGYVYRDRQQAHGPCTKAHIKLGARPQLRALCRGNVVHSGFPARIAEDRWFLQFALGGHRLCMDIHGSETARGRRSTFAGSGRRPLTWPP